MVCDNGSGEIHLGYLIFVCEDVMSKNCTKLISMVICGGQFSCGCMLYYICMYAARIW